MDTLPNLDAMLDTARSAVRAASALCMLVADSGPERLEKAGREPVTLADYGSQAVILGAVAAAFPDQGVLAEEGSAHLLAEGGAGSETVASLVAQVTGSPCGANDLADWIDHAGGGGQPVWAVDPLDGTKGFLRGDQFAVAVGLLDDGVPAAGVLGCPRLTIGDTTGVLLWGVPGRGAWMEPLAGGPATPISVSAVAEPASVRVLGSVEISHGDPAAIQRVVDLAGFGGGWVRIDSQAKYAAVGAGLAEVYLRPVSRPDWRERVWDHAAGAAIVIAAGGTVTDLDGRNLDFTTGPTLEHNRGVVATNGAIHELVLGSLADSEG
ncbi:MAG: inositol monophosphatase family protein [Acidimicrobiia bacterium]